MSMGNHNNDNAYVSDQTFQILQNAFAEIDRVSDSIQDRKHAEKVMIAIRHKFLYLLQYIGRMERQHQQHIRALQDRSVQTDMGGVKNMDISSGYMGTPGVAMDISPTCPPAPRRADTRRICDLESPASSELQVRKRLCFGGDQGVSIKEYLSGSILDNYRNGSGVITLPPLNISVPRDHTLATS